MSFLSGSAKVNINPDRSIFSLALAGYGAPYEGRFSLAWETVQEYGDLVSVTSWGDTLYGLNSSGYLLKGSWELGSVKWDTIGYIPGLKSITFLAEVLFALDTGGDVLEINLYNGLSIKQRLTSEQHFRAIVGLGNELYGVDNANILYVCRAASTPHQWLPVGDGLSIQSLTADGNCLYALDDAQTIWYTAIDAGIHWVKIARKNEYSINQSLRQIYYFQKAFYAISQDGKLLRSLHSIKYDLYATAVAIGDGQNSVVIVGIDCTGFDYDFIEEIKREVTAKTGIPAEAVLINASHTHFAPVTQNWRTWQAFYQEPDSRYLSDHVKKGVIEAIVSARSAMVPVHISFVRGRTTIGYNRRKDVQAQALHDDTLDVLKIVDHQNKVKQIVYLAACHPVFKNSDENSPFTLSANFPGVCRKLMEENYQVDVLFLQGFAGDVNPIDSDYEQTGQKLYLELDELLIQKSDLLEGEVSASFQEISVGLNCLDASEFQEFYKKNKQEVDRLSLSEQPVTPVGQFVLTPLMEKRKNLRWVALMKNGSGSYMPKQTMPVYVQVINIGKWKLLGLSREVVSDYAEPLRALWPENEVSLAAYCNDVSSYLPCDWHIEQQTYEGYDSFFWYGSSGIPAIDIKNEVINQISKLKL